MENEKPTWNATAVLLCIVLIAANMRTPITTVGPVIPEIAQQLHLTPVMIGLFTTVPLVCFALLSTFMPRLSGLFGLEKSLLYSSLILAIGLIIRSLGNVFVLFTGYLLIGIAITIANVLMPAFIKKKFPDRLGLVTAIYLVSMNLTSALAVGYSINIGKIGELGWQGSIGIWTVLSFFTFFCWIPMVPKRKKMANLIQGTLTRELFKSRLAWHISIFMGSQSLVFYVFGAWLPAILQEWGMPAEKAGWMLAYVQTGQVPMMLIGPLLADRMKKQNILVWLSFILLAAGLTMIIIWKTAFIILSVLLVGIAVGLAFTLATMFFVLRTKYIEESAALSGMSQSVGYFLAAIGPPFFGILYALTKSWFVPLLILLVSSLVLLFTGLKGAENRYVFEKRKGSALRI